MINIMVRVNKFQKIHLLRYSLYSLLQYHAGQGCTRSATKKKKICNAEKIFMRSDIFMYTYRYFYERRASLWIETVSGCY